MAYNLLMTRTASTTASVGSWVAGASRPRRLKFYEVMIAAGGTPADNAWRLSVQRCTAAGTSTAVTPQPLDPADFATESAGGQNHTVEPTYTANALMLDFDFNQRATVRWFAREGSEIITPATASNGLGFQTPSSTAVEVRCQAWAIEL